MSLCRFGRHCDQFRKGITMLPLSSSFSFRLLRHHTYEIIHIFRVTDCEPTHSERMQTIAHSQATGDEQFIRIHAQHADDGYNLIATFVHFPYFKL